MNQHPFFDRKSAACWQLILTPFIAKISHRNLKDLPLILLTFADLTYDLHA